MCAIYTLPQKKLSEQPCELPIMSPARKDCKSRVPASPGCRYLARVIPKILGFHNVRGSVYYVSTLNVYEIPVSYT